MRNEIFACHGYCFKKKIFASSLKWKIGMFPIRRYQDLTDIEKQNIAIIKRYEKYAVTMGMSMVVELIIKSSR
jgi:hypothetical protein